MGILLGGLLPLRILVSDSGSDFRVLRSGGGVALDILQAGNQLHGRLRYQKSLFQRGARQSPRCGDHAHSGNDLRESDHRILDSADPVGKRRRCQRIVRVLYDHVAVCTRFLRSVERYFGNFGLASLSTRTFERDDLFPSYHYQFHIQTGFLERSLRYGRHNLSGFHFRKSEDRERNTAHSPVEQHISELFGRRLLPFVGVRRIGIGTLDKDSRCYGQFVSARCPDCDGLVPPRYDFRDENGLFQHRLRHGRCDLSRLYLGRPKNRTIDYASNSTKRYRSQRDGRFRDGLVGVVLERRPVECDFGYDRPDELPTGRPRAKYMVPPGLPFVYPNGLFQLGLG